MDLSKFPLEIMEAERLIERDKIILRQHIKIEEMQKEILALREQLAGGAGVAANA